MNKKEMADFLSFSYTPNPMNARKFTTSEIARGTGIIRPKKGKGSYRRQRQKISWNRQDDPQEIFYWT